MPQQVVPVYSQEDKRQLRLNTCRGCIFSQCNGNQSDKCNINSLVCSKDNNKNIITKTNDVVTETCPMGYWDNTNTTKIIEVKSCGCKGK